MTKNYDEGQVKSLQGLKGIRAKISMYMGDLDTVPWTAVREAADNCADEFIAGRNDLCYIHIGKQGNWVADNGQGIPTGNIDVEDPVTHTKHKISAFKAIVSLVHTGGKFDDEAYKVARGSHGTGIKGTNAASSKFQAWTFYKGQWYTLAYAKGVETQALTKVKTGPKLPNGKTPTKGTVIYTEIDKTLVPSTKIDLKLVQDWAKVSAYLMPGFKVILEAGTKSKTYFFKDGPKAFVKDTCDRLECTTLGQVFYATSPLCDIALAFTDYDGRALSFYTNALNNIDGGTHASSTYSALYACLKPYAKRGKDNFTIEDIKEGLIGIVNVKLSAPKFSSQTKEKLSDERAKGPLLELLTSELEKFFKGNKALAGRICERAAQLKDLKNQFTASKKVLKELNNVKKFGMPSKFAGANRAKPEDRETYVVEGESAAGTAVKARDYHFQEVLPLKGKIMNAGKAKGDSVLESEEVIYILAALGYDPKASDPLSKLRTGKFICLADADADGQHINSLLLTLLWKYIPGLFTRGMVFIADSPEYCAIAGKEKTLYTGNTLDEVKAKVPKGTDILHLKGWGEASVDLLKKVAFDPKSRTLIKIGVIDKAGNAEFVKLMGEDTQYRKTLMGI